jgi:hypothetical protein
LRIGKHLLESFITRDNIVLRESTSIKTIDEDWIMTVGGQPVPMEGKNTAGELTPLVFLQGLSSKQRYGRIEAMVSLTLTLLS